MHTSVVHVGESKIVVLGQLRMRSRVQWELCLSKNTYSMIDVFNSKCFEVFYIGSI